MGKDVTRSVSGSGEVIAFGKRGFLFQAARIFVREVLTEGFLRLPGQYLLIPVAGLYAVGILDDISGRLEEITIAPGNIRFSIMRIDLTAVAVSGDALGVGIGLGMQQIAANFASGIILLVEGQTTSGDYVELDGGAKATIIKVTARACVPETFDRHWILVPNDHFITTRVINYSDQGSATRYEAAFSVSCETDINRGPAIIDAAVAALPIVQKASDGPGCALKGFGESVVDFAVEYWVIGLGVGKKKYVPPVLFAIWNALKADGIKMPCPHRVMELRGGAIA